MIDSWNIVITEADYARLARLIDSVRRVESRDAEHVDGLERELERATIVRASEVAADVVTMNSRVRVVDLNTGRELTYQVVFPSDADVAKNRISVLAPIGTGLLGCRAGATLEWQVPAGLRRMRIVEIEYQPEATGAAA